MTGRNNNYSQEFYSFLTRAKYLLFISSNNVYQCSANIVRRSACQLNVRLEMQLVLCRRLQVMHTFELLPLETGRHFVPFH